MPLIYPTSQAVKVEGVHGTYAVSPTLGVTGESPLAWRLTDCCKVSADLKAGGFVSCSACGKSVDPACGVIFSLDDDALGEAILETLPAKYRAAGCDCITEVAFMLERGAAALEVTA